ncbi:MAG: hypothetical protein NW202_13315 [Nitrospira sp.]|nr:hypothetical protein [Nitrospira sp.]
MNKKRTAKKKPTLSDRIDSLAGELADELAAEARERRVDVGGLTARMNALVTQIAALERQLADRIGTPDAPPKPVLRDDLDLACRIVETVVSKVAPAMTGDEAAELCVAEVERLLALSRGEK